ncbi:MAG: hypothetical protein IR527_01955 [Bacteroides sp.]|nr:MAG: hypothetical protein IR527_01955 [Bacteroides sp.]
MFIKICIGIILTILGALLRYINIKIYSISLISNCIFWLGCVLLIYNLVLFINEEN